MLNAILTVREKRPMSHADFGWQQFTDAVIATVVRQRPGVVFLLWGGPAQKKSTTITALSPPGSRHLVVCAAHPSPMAGPKFLGCKCFSSTNAHLRSIGVPEIDWHLDTKEEEEEEDSDF